MPPKAVRVFDSGGEWVLPPRLIYGARIIHDPAVVPCFGAWLGLRWRPALRVRGHKCVWPGLKRSALVGVRRVRACALLGAGCRPHLCGTAEQDPEDAVQRGSFVVIQGLQQIAFVCQGERSHFPVDGFSSLGQA